MTPDVTRVRTLRPYVIEVSFADGVRRQVNLADELYGPLFEPLRDPRYFEQVCVDVETGTVTWPNGADFSPEFLYSTMPVESYEAAERRTS